MSTRTGDTFDYVRLVHSTGSSARIYLYGAHITSWVDANGRENFFLSRRARFGNGRSIRGGIPVVFPQFADTGPLPKHGLVRTRPWTVTQHDDSSATLRITDDEQSRALWPYPFLAELTASVDECLTVSLAITNTGPSPFSFTAALHNYFSVDDVTTARVEGLSGVTYRDKVQGGIETKDESESVAISDETDRVYVDAPRDVRIAHVAGSKSIGLRAMGFGDWVVWNPWRELTASLDDMGDDDYLRMLCVEAARISAPVTLAPGATWTGTQIARSN